MSSPSRFSPPIRGETADIEEGLVFQPKLDADGLIPAIVTHWQSGVVLMFAFMSEEALRLTLETGYAHFWSRSRRRIWKKGEESGNRLRVHEMRTDCDQDVLWLRVAVAGDGPVCHTGRRSCFYRIVRSDDPAAPRLAPADDDPQAASS